MVSEAVIAHDPDIANNVIDPPAAAFIVACRRVVTALAFAVPFAPGSPVWIFTYNPGTSAGAMPRSQSRTLFATLTVLIPTVIYSSPSS